MKEPTDARYARPRSGSSAWLYQMAVSLAGTITLALAVARLLGPAATPDQIARHPLFWVIAAMIVAGEVWRIALPGRSGPDTPAASVATAVGVLLFWGFPIAAVLRVSAIAVVAAAQRKAPLRIAFYAAQHTLSLAAAGAVLSAFGVRASPAHPWVPTGTELGMVLAAAGAYFIVNFALVTCSIVLTERRDFADVVKSIFGYKGITLLLLFATAPLVAVAIGTGSALIVGLFVVPLAAVYLGASASVQREYQVSHDELTGLLNRKLLVKRGIEAVARAASAGTKAAFLLIDLDRSTGLKEVNDTLGHAVGDRLLQIVAHRLSHAVRPGDVVARLGGDEFAILLPSVKEPGMAREVASRLRVAMAEPVRLESTMFQVQASIGIAVYPDDADGFDQLMQRADVAMYLAKERHSGIERYLAHADRNSAERLALLGDLRTAVRRGEIDLHFQPKVLLADERVIGMEALARWRHPRRGTLDAADFVGLAEQSDLMSELTEQVIDKALAQAARWWQLGLAVQVSVNVPARDLMSTRLPEIIKQVLDKYKMPPAALRIDINEQVLAGRASQAALTVRALADLGVGVSLDDFGTGISSLAQLYRLGITEVKFDPVLVSGLNESPEQTLTVKSLVKFAQALGIRSIGEGVENDATAAALRLMGCDGAQGWHFGKPLDSATATDWLSEHYVGSYADGQLVRQNGQGAAVVQWPGELDRMTVQAAEAAEVAEVADAVGAAGAGSAAELAASAAEIAKSAAELAASVADEAEVATAGKRPVRPLPGAELARAARLAGAPRAVPDRPAALGP